MSNRALKPLCEMTAQELQEEIERASGLPVPDSNASPEVYAQWYVAAVFLLHHQCITDVNKAKISAVNSLLQDFNYWKKLPYIEQALGRKLTKKEIKGRCIMAC